MPHAFRLLAAVALMATALAASAARAQGEPGTLELRARSAADHLRYASPGVPALRSGSGLAISEHLPGLRLWATGAGYAVGRRSAGYGLGAGAALPIHEHLSLTAGYRITGYSSGAHLDGDVEQVEDRVAGAYFGFDVEF